MGESIWDDRFDQPQAEMEWEKDGSPEAVDEPLSFEAQSLLYVGYLTDQFTFAGHSIKIATLVIGDELQAALLAQKFGETDHDGVAWVTAQVAAAVREVNGKILVPSLGPSEDDRVERQWNYITKKWHWPVIRAVYDRYVKLLEKQRAAIEELEKKSPAGPTTLKSSSD